MNKAETARREYDKLDPYTKLNIAYQELSVAYGDRGRRITHLEGVLKLIADTPSLSTKELRRLANAGLKGEL